MNKKTIIHINQHKIRQNKDGENRPVITCKTYNSNTYAHQVIIYGVDGKEAAKIVYSPDKPLSCGAKVWIETKCEIKITQNKDNEKISRKGQRVSRLA